jgi:DNA-binding MarR family transcriptional regulator
MMGAGDGSVTTDTAGAWLFARYAYAPNKLGYCGPARAQLLLNYGATGAVDVDLRALAREFHGAWTYMETMAELTGLGDPLDRRIVESYWLGGGVSQAVDPHTFGEMLLARIGRKTSHYWAHLTPETLDGAAADHCFHVFAVYPWSRLLGPEHYAQPLHVLDNCRIRWGTVLSREGDVLVVRSRRLTWDGYRLGLSRPQVERVGHAAGGLSFLPDVMPGDRVAMHWDWTCDRLSDHQVAALRSATINQIEATNRRLAPAAARPEPVSEPVPAPADYCGRRIRTRTVNDAAWLAAHLRSMITGNPCMWVGSDVTLLQLSALHFISASAPVTLSSLAECLGTRLPATSAMVDRLIRLDLVSRTRDRQDRRRVLLVLSKNGKRMIGKIDPETAIRLQRALRDLSPAATRCLTDVLRNIAGRLIY